MSVHSPNSTQGSHAVPEGSAAFSRTDVLFVMSLLGVLTAVAIPLLAGPRPQQDFAVCRNNLRQIGQAFLSFADAHGDKLPPALKPSAGGANLDGTAASLFRPLSNYLASPRLLSCPGSPRRSAASFEALRDANISYLIGAHAAPDRSWEILSGDFDIQGGTSATCSYLGNVIVTSFPGSVGLPDTFTVSWSGSNHVASGNLLLSDGSVTGGDSKRLQRSIADSAREGSQSVHVLPPK